MSRKMPPERFRYSTGGAPGVAARDHEHLGLADLARDQTLLERRERRVEAALEADHADHAGLLHGVGAGARAIHREIDRLLAEDGLAGTGRARDEIGVGVGRRADHDGADGLVAQRGFRAHDLRAMLVGQRLRGRGVDVDHVTQFHTRLAGHVAGVDLADPAGAEQCNFGHRFLQAIT
jgi:hypothetical protein